MTAWIFRGSRWAAYLGGVVLCALTLMIVVSVLGRAMIGLGLGPVPGDFELAEVGTAVAVFFFLPWCYLKGGHATVDMFYVHLPKPIQWVVVTLSDIMMLVVWLAMTWMLWEGLLEKREYMETTFILQMPIWWAYALCMVGAVMGCLAYINKTLIQFGVASYPQGWTIDTTGGH